MKKTLTVQKCGVSPCQLQFQWRSAKGLPNRLLGEKVLWIFPHSKRDMTLLSLVVYFRDQSLAWEWTKIADTITAFRKPTDEPNPMLARKLTFQRMVNKLVASRKLRTYLWKEFRDKSDIPNINVSIFLSEYQIRQSGIVRDIYKEYKSWIKQSGKAVGISS